MCQSKVEDGAIRVATYNRDHVAVMNDDGTIDVYRRPTGGNTADAAARSRAAFENLNRRHAEFWAQQGGMR